MSRVYDQDLELEFSWVEPVRNTKPTHSSSHEREVVSPTYWQPPAFTCQRRLPSKRRSFLVGIGGVVDFFGISRLWTETGLYRTEEMSPNHANALAIYSDWCAVGRDLHQAVDSFERTELERVELQNR
jgi:hypothetical protein